MEIQKAIQKEMDDFMQSERFTHEATKHFARIPEILKKVSPHSLKIPLDAYASLASVTPENCNLEQAGSCFNMMMGQTCASLGMELDEYIKMYGELEEGVKAWNAITIPKRKAAQNKLEALTEVENKSGRKIDMPVPAKA